MSTSEDIAQKEKEPTQKEIEPAQKEIEPAQKEKEPTQKEKESIPKEKESTSKQAEESKPVKDTKKGLQLEPYFCSKCKIVPKIKLQDDLFVQTTCACKSEKKVLFRTKTYAGPSASQSANLNKMTLKNYISEITSKREEYPDCSFSDKHENDKECPQAVCYCSNCKRWFCNQCLEDHNKNDSYADHIYFNSNGFELFYECENEECESGDPIEFYCKKCKLHFCKKCGKEHASALKNHEVVDLASISLSPENVNIFKDDIELLSRQEKQKTAECKNYLNNLSETIRECKELIKEKEEENENIRKFFLSLFTTYEIIKDLKNFNVRNNLDINKIDHIYEIRDALFQEKFKSKIYAADSKYLTEMKPVNNYICCKYDVKESDKTLKIFGDKFFALNPSNCTMFINGKKVKVFKKKFEDDTKGLVTLEILMKEGQQIESMSYMFAESMSLVSVDFSKLDTSKVTNMKSMFFNCAELQDVIFGHFDTSNVTNMEKMFWQCQKLKKLNLASFKTSKVTNMEGMFSLCNSLGNVNLNSFDTSLVTKMNYMFYQCESMNKINLGNFNTSNVTNMSFMFCYCYSLNSLNLSNFNTEKVTNMSHMFSYCPSLNNLNIDNFNTSNVTNMDNMFSHCVSLSKLNLYSFYTEKVIDMNEMFCFCNSLHDLDISYFDATNVKNWENIFSKCTNLTNVTLPSNIDKVSKFEEMLKNCPLSKDTLSRFEKSTGFFSFFG